MKKASLLIGLCLVLAAPLALAQGTAFTYQGRLNSGTNLANGSYDLSFALFTVSSGAGQVGSSVTNSAVGISNGLFTVALDFGANFPGANRWLEIGVRTNGAGVFTTLTPRQKLTAAPYAITANNLSGPLSSASFSGTYTGAITLNNVGNSFSGSGSGLTGVNAITLGGLGADSFWRLLGNGGTTAGVNFLGTTDNQPLELKVNNTRAFRLEPNGTSPNLIGGYLGNAVTGGALGATIAGGGSSGAENMIQGIFGTIGGGLNNIILDASDYATIGGGGGNEVGSGGIPFTRYSTVGGGAANRVRSRYSTVGGGLQNFIGASGAGDEGSTIGGGVQNSISLDFGAYATIGGGYSNFIYHGTGGTIGGGSGNENGASGAVIGGGSGNSIAGYDLPPGSANSSVIAGGSGNSIDNGGVLGTISGGSKNSIETTDWDLPPWGAAIGGGGSNRVSGTHGTVSGGELNAATNAYSTVAGGRENVAGGFSATVAGGTNNSALSESSTISGGSSNLIAADAARYGTIAGGSANELGYSGFGTFAHYSAIGGGLGNRAWALYSVIGGGASNSAGSGFYNGYAVIGGGFRNSAEGNYPTIGGGADNRVGGCTAGTVSGGLNNYASASRATIGGGENNTIAGDCDFGPTSPFSTIGGGANNFIDLADSGSSTISGGYSNRISTSSGQGSIGGGTGNWVASENGTIPGGSRAKTSSYGQMAHASGQFSNTGDAQTSVYVCRTTTTTTNMTELFLDGVGERMIVPVNSTWVFEVLVTGRSASGNSAGYQIRGTIKNNAGTTAIVGAPVFTALGSDVPSWDASVSADNANDALRVNVNGSAGTSVRWVASVRTTEVSF